MRFNTIQSFAGGLIVAASVCGIVYFSSPSEAESVTAEPEAEVDVEKEEEMKDEEPDIVQVDDKEIIELLRLQGYLIHTEEEFHETIQEEIEAAMESERENHDKQLEELQKELEEKAKATKEESKKKDNDSNEGTVYRTMLSVVPGMTSYDVGQALENANIIKSSSAFRQEVENQGVATNLKPGTYEVTSEMSMKEIISVIFKK
ncbi:endolytic transglycosylase MltG [Bacillus alkalicellulosilyticus]|uniref:endolytic transglycosylase MltG n=1 Tax=Alkalihalobacterium alkalicellulosilyticum TaxID=1912214 RepID=UPI001481F7F0|nr:endolytic transglycosylase MltG [Bacillus alkalicellulosilyticus]